MWACTNLPPSSTCLILDIYEIYEAIPESEAINILQVRTSDLDLEDQKTLLKVLNSTENEDLMHPEEVKTPSLS